MHYKYILIIPFPKLYHHFGKSLLMVLTYEQIHLHYACMMRTCDQPLQLYNLYFLHLVPNLPAYCLANLAMSSLLKTYCFVAIQCRRSSTTRTVTVVNTNSLKQVLTTGMVETTRRHTHSSSNKFCYMRTVKWTGFPLHATSSGGETSGFFLVRWEPGMALQPITNRESSVEKFDAEVASTL